MLGENTGELHIHYADGGNLGHGMEQDPLSVRIWEAVIMLSTFLSLLFSSFLASYDSTNQPLLILLYMCDFLYLIDTIIRLYRPNYVVDKTTGKRNNKRQISKTTVFFDLLSLFPFELFAFAKKSSYPWLHATSVHRLNRIARFYRIFTYFSRCEDRLGTNIQLIRSLKHFFVAYGVVHLMACGWFVLSCENKVVHNATCFEESWAAGEHDHQSRIPNGEMIHFSTLEKYITCLYWAAITATSTGYGDIHAANTNEKWYSVLCMLIGILYFYGSILGDMGSSMTNADQKRACYKHKLNAISDHLDYRKVSKDIGKNVQGYYEHMWIQNQGISGIGMFHELPMTFQAELSLDVNRHVLEKAPLFKDTCPGFKRMLSMSIKSTTYYPGQIVFRKNDIGHSLYYIRNGEVKILSEDSEKPIKVFCTGSFFGEISLLWNVPRAATAVASCYSDILALDRTDLNKVMKHYPEAYETLRLTIEQRYNDAQTNKKKKILLDVKDDENMYQQNSKQSTFESLRKLVFEGIFLPESTFIKKWSRLIFSLTAIFITVHTFVASFLVSFGCDGYGDNAGLKIVFGFWYIYDVLIVLDILIGLRTAVHHSKRGFVKDSEEIMNLRLKSVSFWLDILSVLPIEVFAFCFATAEKQWFAATFLKSNRIIRIFHIPQFFKRLEENINNNIAKSRTVMLFLYMFLVTHLTACMMYLQAYAGERCSVPSWVHAVGIDKSTHVVHHYMLSVYWACATMTSTGYGDISAMSFRDEVCVLFVLFIGLLMYGYCLSSIAATLNNAVAPKTTFMEHITAVLNFMKSRHISEELMKEVESYLKLVWRIHRGQSLPGARTLMDDMPLSLQEDVAYDEMKQILQDVPIFRDTDERFLKMISVVTRTFLFTPGDTIVQVGDMRRELYIVRRGHAEVLSADRSCVVATCGPGGYFGEVGFLYGESRPSDVRAKTYCEIVMISKADMDKVLEHFPVIAKQLQNIIENIAVLKRLKSNAHDEAKRSHKEQVLLNSKKINLPKPQKESASHHWKLGKINPLYTEGARKISLPSRFTGFNSDKNSTPEYRQQRMLILQKQEQREYQEQLNVFMRLLSMFLMKRTISPDSGFFRAWIFITVSLAYIYLILIGFSMTFLHAEETIAYIEGLFDIFFLIDMYIKLHVCFYNDKGILVSHSMETAKNYLRTNFLLDLLAIIPFNFMTHSHSSELSYFGKINRILHIVKVAQFFSFFQMEVGARTNMIRHIALNSYLVLMMHYFACAWYLVACSEFSYHHHSHDPHENATLIDAGISSQKIDFHHKHFKCGETSWVLKTKTVKIYHESYVNQYITCLYWAISTLCSVGYGDIHAYVSSERLLASVCMIFGVVFFGYIITAALASRSNSDAQKSFYVERLQGIERFLVDQEICASLGQRVLNHYQYVWQKTLGVDMKNLFEGLPISIQGKICLSLYQSYLTSVPLFDGLEVGFIKMLSLVIKPLYILKNEYIVRKGDIAQQMFFIERGTVEVVSEDDEPQVLDTMNAGSFFGEISMVSGAHVDASIRALTNMDLLILSKKDLDGVLEDFPQFKRKIMKKVQQILGHIDEEETESDDEANEDDDIGSQEKETHFGGQAVKENPSISGKNKNIESMNTDAAPPIKHFANKIDEAHSTNERRRSVIDNFAHLYRTLTSWNRFVIDQNSPVRYIRQLNCVAIFMTYLTITYEAAFQDHQTALIIFSYVCEASFFLQIYLNFHMAYSTDDGEIVNDFDQIFMHYCRGKFKFDVIANIPLELFTLAFSNDLRLTVFSYLRLIHLLRIVRVVQIYNEWVKELAINMLLMRFSENLVQVSLYVHSFACVWYIVACPSSCSKSSWVADLDHGTTKPLFSRYADSVYWAVATMTSTGYGDIHANNKIEMIFASIIIVSGKVIFGFVLGTITSALANLEAHRVDFEDKLTVVQAHMRSQKISASLQERVVHFFRYNWAKNRGLPVSSLLNDMPYCLHAEVCYALIGDIVKEIPMFRSCGMPFRRLLCTKAQFCHFYPGEYVMNDGDIGQGMYIVRRGKVESFSAERAEQTRFYSDGDFFGEENVIRSRPCTETIKTVTHADLFLFTKSDIQCVLQAFREEAIVVDQNTRRLRRLSVIEEEV